MEVIIVPVVEVESSGWHSGRFVWANPKISNEFSPIFPSFVHFLSTKPMTKWSKHLASFWVVSFSKFFKFADILSFHFLKIWTNVEFIHQFDNIQSTCSPSLKFLLYWAHLFSFSQPLHCVSATKMQKQKQYMHLERLFYREGGCPETVQKHCFVNLPLWPWYV